MIEVIDMHDNGLTSEILEGGIGQDYVKLKIRRLVGRRIYTIIRIYGYEKKLKTTTISTNTPN